MEVNRILLCFITRHQIFFAAVHDSPRSAVWQFKSKYSRCKVTAPTISFVMILFNGALALFKLLVLTFSLLRVVSNLPRNRRETKMLRNWKCFRIVSANRFEHLRLLAPNYEQQLPCSEVEQSANLICGCLTWVCIGSWLIKPASSDKSVIKSFSGTAETSFTMEYLLPQLSLPWELCASFQISRQHALRQLKCGIMDEHGMCKSREDNELLFDLLKTTTAARYSQRRRMEIHIQIGMKNDRKQFLSPRSSLLCRNLEIYI